MDAGSAVYRLDGRDAHQPRSAGRRSTARGTLLVIGGNAPDMCRRPCRMRMKLSSERTILSATLSRDPEQPRMKMIVAIKQVPERDAQLAIAPDGKWINEADLAYTINEPDAYALEEALQLKEEHGGEVIALCAGPERVTSDPARSPGQGRRPSHSYRRGRPGPAGHSGAGASAGQCDPRGGARPHPHRPAVRRSGSGADRRGAGRAARYPACQPHPAGGSHRRSACA